jgi:hypothetical protein
MTRTTAAPVKLNALFGGSRAVTVNPRYLLSDLICPKRLPTAFSSWLGWQPVHSVRCGLLEGKMRIRITAKHMTPLKVLSALTFQ